MNKRIDKSLWPETCHGRWMTAAYEPGLVSVIIPTYSRAEMLIEAMDSVYAQTYRPIELLVVDDGSTDNTRQAVAAWTARYSTDSAFVVRYFHQANQGAQVARNLGSIQSHGEYIQYLDSDDLLLPEKLGSQVAEFIRNNIDYIYSITQFEDLQGNELRRFGVPLPCRDDRPWVTAHSWPTCSPLFKRMVCVGVGPWDEDLSACQEYEYAARIKACGFEGSFIHKVQARARIHDGPSVSQQPSADYGMQCELAAQKVLDVLEVYSLGSVERNRVAGNLVRVALRYARRRKSKDARRCLRKAYRAASGTRRAVAYALFATSFLFSPRLLLEGARQAERILALLRAGGSRVARGIRFTAPMQP